MTMNVQNQLRLLMLSVLAFLLSVQPQMPSIQSVSLQTFVVIGIM